MVQGRKIPVRSSVQETQFIVAAEGIGVQNHDKNDTTGGTKFVVQGSEAQSDHWPRRSFCRKVEAIELVSDCW